MNRQPQLDWNAFGFVACLQVLVAGIVVEAYAYDTASGPSDEFGGVLLCAMGLIGAWFFWRQRRSG
jgi:hypothetical protein